MTNLEVLRRMAQIIASAPSPPFVTRDEYDQMQDLLKKFEREN